ncbi:MAG: DUF2306 domain-containing protein [Pseudomonadota bacterium]
MSQAADTLPAPTSLSPGRILSQTAALWLVVAAVGHLIFLVYIVGYYWLMLAGGGAAALADTHLPNGFVEGDPLGNAAVIAHIVLAAIVIGGGPLQLIPAVRARFPAFHRWLGRSYLLAAAASSVAGLFMILSRGTIGGLVNEVAIALDGILILIFAAFAVRHAMAGNIVRHRRWALRLFLVASGVWFFRVGLMGWVFMTGGIGIEWETFSGPFIVFWSFAQYLLPLALLELYFAAQKSLSGALKVATSSVLLAFTAAMAVGIFAATMSLWLPRL